MFFHRRVNSSLTRPESAFRTEAFHPCDLAKVGNRIYERISLRATRSHRGVDLILEVLPFGRLWYDTPDHAIGYAMHSSRSHDAVIRVYDAAGNVIETHEQGDDFKE